MRFNLKFLNIAFISDIKDTDALCGKAGERNNLAAPRAEAQAVFLGFVSVLIGEADRIDQDNIAR